MLKTWIKNVFKCEYKTKEYWHSLAMLFSLYFFMLWLIAVTGYCITGKAAESPFKNIWYDSNKDCYIATTYSATYTPGYIDSLNGIYYIKPSGSSTWTSYSGTYFSTSSSLQIVKLTSASLSGSDRILPFIYVEQYNDGESIYFNELITSSCYLYLEGFDEYGYKYLFSIEVSDSLNPGISISRVLQKNYDNIYYRYDGGRWRICDPTDISSVTFYAVNCDITLSSDSIFSYIPKYFLTDPNPTPTLVPSSTPIPTPAVSVVTNDFISQHLAFDSYQDFCGFWSAYSGLFDICIYFPTSPDTNFEAAQIGIYIGELGSINSASSNLSFYKSVYRIRYNHDYSFQSSYTQFGSGSVSVSYWGVSNSLIDYPSGHRCFAVFSQRTDFDVSQPESWPMFSGWSSSPILTPSPISPGLSPTPIPSQIPTPTPSPAPTNIPNNPLLTDYPRPSSIPNYTTINIPDFDFDFNGFQNEFDKTSTDYQQVFDSVDLGWLGVVDFFPSDFWLLLWLPVGCGVVALIIRNLKR